MTEKTIPFNELQKQVLGQLRKQGYMDSTLRNYRGIYSRVHIFLNAQGADIYTKEAGKKFLYSRSVCGRTLTSYTCAIRRLDDYIEGNPYRCHYGNQPEKVVDIYSIVLYEYLEECKKNGNAPATIYAKEKSCVSLLNYVEQAGCLKLSDLDTRLLSQALLIYSNKDRYAHVRHFLYYLAERGAIKPGLARVIPLYTRHKVLPITYTPEEIVKVESSIKTETNTGKRNLAIVRLATRMGLRSGDIAKLKWSEVDFESGYISIIQEKTSQPLSLQMPQEVSAALLSHLENLPSLSEDGYVFHSMRAPYNRITTSIIGHVVNNGFIEARIDITGKRHGPHVFRSSLASSMINDGASYETVRRILGHSDPDVIKHYARIDAEKLRLCSLEPPAPSGLFEDYLSGKKVIAHV